MKKLFLLASLCIPSFTHSIANNYIEDAIRSIDIRAVEQIVEREKFTSREYNRYVRLAEEMVRSREIWLLKPDYHNDVTTPSEVPSRLRMFLEGYACCGGLFMEGFCAEYYSETGNKDPLIISSWICAVLFAKYIYDIRKCFTADQDQKERLRKKYENAVTIRQLVYAADIVEA
jgi:hypothetical protein